MLSLVIIVTPLQSKFAFQSNEEKNVVHVVACLLLTRLVYIQDFAG